MKDPVAAHFERFSERYAEHFRNNHTAKDFNFGLRLALVSKLAAPLSGRLLDCACGTGEITCAVLKSGNFQHATVIDVAASMLHRARKLITSEIQKTDLHIIQGDIFDFRKIGEQFDLIMCLGLIAHVGRLDILLPHLRSHLAPGGRILLQTTLSDHLGTRIERALAARRHVARRGYAICYFSKIEIANACRNAGLQIVEIRRHGLGIPFGDRIWAWGNYQLEKRFQKRSEHHGADAVYLLAHDT